MCCIMHRVCAVVVCICACAVYRLAANAERLHALVWQHGVLSLYTAAVKSVRVCLKGISRLPTPLVTMLVTNLEVGYQPLCW